MIKYEDVFNKMNCFEESLKFDWYRYSQHQEVKAVCKKIISEMDFESLKIKRVYKSKSLLKALILNFYVGYKSGKCISIPRSENFYSNNKNFNFEKISYTLFLSVLDFLVKNNYVKEILGKKNNVLKNGYISRYWATSKLYNEFTCINWEMVETRPRPEIMMKNDEKQLINFKGTEFTKNLRSDLKGFNRLYDENDFRTVLQDENNTTRLYPRLSAIYNRNSWNLGGRLYDIPCKSKSYMNITSLERSRILINGDKTVELDYSGLHLNLLYAKMNIQLDKDPYSFVSPDMRKYAKLAVLVLINASDERNALYCLIKNYPECKEWRKILTACKKEHHAIKKYFSSGHGISLQNLDGQMSREIVNYFTMLNIPCLPIHDSYRVPERYEQELREIMHQTYRKHNKGFSCGISLK